MRYYIYTCSHIYTYMPHKNVCVYIWPPIKNVNKYMRQRDAYKI